MSIPTLPDYPLPASADFPASRANWQLEPPRAVLLIHDMQRYFLSFYGEDSPLATTLIERIAGLRRWARQHGVPVVYTAQPSEQSPRERALLNDIWGPGLTQADPALQAVTPRLAPEADDTVLVKWRYSAFQRSDLRARMQDWGRDQLLICGVYAHIGCMLTAAEAFMCDIQPFMVGDAVADFSRQEHDMALRYVAGRCGRVIAAAEVETGPDFTRDWLRRQVLAVLEDGDESILDDDNLLDYGLDSVQLMALLSHWHQQGLSLSLEALAARPSLAAWWQLIDEQRGAPSH